MLELCQIGGRGIGVILQRRLILRDKLRIQRHHPGVAANRNILHFPGIGLDIVDAWEASRFFDFAEITGERWIRI